MNSAEFTKRLSIVMSTYKRDLSESEAQLWCSLLESNGIRYSDAAKALERHLMNPVEGRFAPKLADISAYINGTPHDVEAEATEAWELAMKAVRGAGSSYDIVFDNPVIHSTINLMGGWQEFAMMETDQTQFIRKDFLKTYQVAKQRKNHPYILRGAPSWNDPKLYGDRAKCLALLRAAENPEPEAPKLPPVSVKSLDGDK